MSGLVEEREYLRVVRERDALAEKVAFYEGDSKALDRASRRRALRRVLREHNNQTFIPLLDGLIQKPHVYADEGGTSWQRQKCYASNARRAMRDAGFVGNPIICAANRAYALTATARAWLRDRIPEAFPQPGGPTR